MEKKYWGVFIHRDADVDWGVDYRVYLAGIFESEGDAKRFSESDACKAFMKYIADDPKEYYPPLDVRTSIEEIGDSAVRPVFIGGASYAE